MLAAQTYSVPPAVLVGIHQVEGGTSGQAVGPNQNGSYDLGPMQINTLWVPKLAKYWRVNESTAHRWIRDDTCTSLPARSSSATCQVDISAMPRPATAASRSISP